MVQDGNNPFKKLGIIRFWIISTIFWVSFPISMLICYIAMGQNKTKQLVRALLSDFLQTIAIICIVIVVMVYAIYIYISGLT